MQLEGGDRRRYARHPMRVPLRLRRRDAGEELALRAADLSEGGLAFVSPEPVPQGEPLEIELPVADERFKVTGAVAACSADPTGASYRVGVAFQEPAMRFRAKIAEQAIRIEALRRELEEARGTAVSLEEAARSWTERFAAAFAELYDS